MQCIESSQCTGVSALSNALESLLCVLSNEQQAGLRPGPGRPREPMGPMGPREPMSPMGPRERMGPMGPRDRTGSMGPRDPMGPMGPREPPWAPWGPGNPWAPWDPGNPWASWGQGNPWAPWGQGNPWWLTSSSIMVPLWLHSGSILATFWLEGAPRGVPVPTDWTKRNQALRCWVRVRVGDGVVISWRVGHWRALGAPRECPWDVLAVFGHPLEPGKRVPIIMSRVMFYYVRNYVREFCANLNQAGWFK